MTEEKRKRGRPPGTGKKKEVVGPFNPDNLQAEVMAVYDAPKIDTMADEHPMYETVAPDALPDLTRKVKEEMEGRGIKPLLVTFPEKLKTETPYPSNWNEMGKIDKLAWLTAHPRK
jgi:hypothetical protein